MSRPFHRFAIVILSLGLPAGAGAWQEIGGEPPAGGSMAQGPQLGARAATMRPMEARRAPSRAAMEPQLADPRRSLSEAVRRVQRRTGGQILGAEVVPYEGRNISRIKYMDDHGRVRYMDDPGPGERLRRVPSEPQRDDHGQP